MTSRSSPDNRRVAIVINTGGGTLRSMDTKAFGDHVAKAFGEAGYEPDLHLCPGKRLVGTIETAARDKSTGYLVACGGDGTISLAAGLAWKHGKVLGVLPGGTMNLYARTLGLPLELEAAAAALAGGKVQKADIATANKRPFIHQFSVGLHARVVAGRSHYQFSSRIGKMIAGIRATLQSFTDPPSFEASIHSGKREENGKFSMIAISNNLYGEGHMPFADRIDEGVAGVYFTGPLTGSETAHLTGDLMLGSWGNNTDFRWFRGDEPVTLKFPRRKSSAKAVIDGELIRLEPEVKIEVHAGELKVLVPEQTE